MYTPLIVFLLAVCACAYDVPRVRVSLLQGGGISFALPDKAGITLVAYHYSINKDVIDTAAGDYNVDVNSAVGGFWIHEDRAVTVIEGDVVHYWVHVYNDGAGYYSVNQQWTAPNTVAESLATTASMEPVARGELIFEDTFEFLNYDNWQHEITAGGGGNWEFQYYTNNRSNSYVRDNTLFIKPTLTADKYGEDFLTTGVLDLWGGSPADLCTGNNWWGCERTGSIENILNPIQSARLRSVNSFAFQYGTMEVIAQMPKGDWIWPDFPDMFWSWEWAWANWHDYKSHDPLEMKMKYVQNSCRYDYAWNAWTAAGHAIWLLSKHNEYGGWPASGEIDLLENRGNRNLRSPDGTHTGTEQIGMTLHWGPYWPLNGWPKTHNTKNLPDGQSFGDRFYNYTFQWTSLGMTFYLDGEVILNVDPGVDGFWEFGGFEDDNPGISNPWINSPNKMAPFDREFYIIMNVAVGGTGYWSDSDINSPYPKPWLSTSPQAAKDFYDAKDDWYPTWNPDTNNGEDAAMKVKSVRVYALPKEGSHSQQLNSSWFLLTLASFVAIMTGIGNKRV